MLAITIDPGFKFYPKGQVIVQEIVFCHPEGVLGQLFHVQGGGHFFLLVVYLNFDSVFHSRYILVSFLYFG